MLKIFVITFSFTLLLSISVDAKEKKVGSKIQEVNFNEMSLKGTIRTPDGAYLVQKKGVQFMPLYDLQKDFDSKIRNTINFIQ